MASWQRNDISLSCYCTGQHSTQFVIVVNDSSLCIQWWDLLCFCARSSLFDWWSNGPKTPFWLHLL